MVNLGLPRGDHASWGKRGRVGVGTSNGGGKSRLCSHESQVEKSGLDEDL